MRIVGGEFRGRALTAPTGETIRPTADRLRQTLFDVLIHSYGVPAQGGRVLDLFAGTGALGIEALSRGAGFALFVEEGAAARGLIRQNVDALGLTGRTRVWRRDATRLGAIGPLAPFHLAFADPPYRCGLGETALGAAAAGGWLAAGAVAVLEEAGDVEVAPIPGLEIAETREVGESRFTIFRVVALADPGSQP